MFIKIYSMNEAEVFQALKLADLESFQMTGSHDDSYRGVSVNGVVYGPFISDHRWTSIQNGYEWSEDHKEPFGRIPKIEEICIASILEKSYHYGGSSRRRSHLRIFVRSVYAQKEIKGGYFSFVENARKEGQTFASHFLVFDLMEVDGWHGGWSIQEALWKASKKVRLEVGEVDEGVFYTWYNSTYSGTTNPNTAEEFFAKAFEKSTAIIGHFKQLFEMLNGSPHGYDDSFREAYLVFARDHSPLGHFLNTYGVD